MFWTLSGFYGLIIRVFGFVKKKGLARAIPIHDGRLLGLLPDSPLTGCSGSPRLLRRRALPSSTWSIELTRLLLSRARGPASPLSGFHGTTTKTRATGVNIRNTGANPKGAGATAVETMSGALAETAGVAPSGIGARAAAARAATTALNGVVLTSLRAGVRVLKGATFECAFAFPPPDTGSFGFWSL